MRTDSNPPSFQGRAGRGERGSSAGARWFLGVVGSSGNSTAPHLHFEVYDDASNLIDPWGGPCNDLGGSSWWQAQRPCYDSALNALMTHDLAPVFPSCPAQETPHARDNFAPGGVAYPSPTNDTAFLEYTVREAGPIRLTVHDAAGRRVSVLFEGPQSAGTHLARWDLDDVKGEPAAAGVYFVRLTSSAGASVAKLVVSE